MADDDAPPATWTRPVLRPWHWLLIACIDIIGPFSTDSYIPNLPEMARELDAPTWLAGLRDSRLQFNFNHRCTMPILALCTW